MATMTETTKGYAHRCILCGAENSVRVKLADVASMECGDCSEELTADDIRQAINAWTRILAFLETSPELED
jgi:predicted nucleic acid-binding Zn ribbon protein